MSFIICINLLFLNTYAYDNNNKFAHIKSAKGIDSPSSYAFCIYKDKLTKMRTDATVAHVQFVCCLATFAWLGPISNVGQSC